MTVLLKQTARTPKARLFVLAMTDIRATAKLVKIKMNAQGTNTTVTPLRLV